MFVKILMIIVFIAMTVCVGVWCRKKAVSVSGFVLDAGRDPGLHQR